jgi:hypothetical protein
MVRCTSGIISVNVLLHQMHRPHRLKLTSKIAFIFLGWIPADNRGQETGWPQASTLGLARLHKTDAGTARNRMRLATASSDLAEVARTRLRRQPRELAGHMLQAEQGSLALCPVLLPGAHAGPVVAVDLGNRRLHRSPKWLELRSELG